MSNFPDRVTQYGGASVDRDIHYAGWWGGDVFFVDFDNGTAGATGVNEINFPAKDLQRAIDAATTDATIYVRPRAFASGTYGEDPQQITPAAADAENWHVDKARKNLSIIGTGKGLSHAAAYKCYIGGYTGLTTAVIDIRSPGCVIENLRAQVPSSGTQGIFYTKNAGGIWDGGNTTFINNDLHDANLTGGISMDSTWQMSIIGNRFVNCDVGVFVATYYSVPQIVEISHNIFNGDAAGVQHDIYSNGGMKRLTVHNNYFAHGTPSLSGGTVYIRLGATSTGMISNNFFGAEGTTDTGFMTLNGCLQSGNHSSDALIVT